MLEIKKHKDVNWLVYFVPLKKKKKKKKGAERTIL